MSRSSAAALCLFVTTLAAQTPPEPLLLKAARLYDGKSDAVVSPGRVSVREGRIVAAGSEEIDPAGARVIDLGDATLCPGFIDCHVHVVYDSGTDWSKDAMDGLRRNVAEHSLHAARNAKRTVEAGFTTVRDLGGFEWIDVGVRNAIRDGICPGPRMLVAGYMLGARGGHADHGGFPYRRFGEETGVAQGIASGADQFRDAVRSQLKFGADVIKFSATGGVLSLTDAVDTPQLTEAETEAIVDETHRLRKRVAAHAHGALGAKLAIRAGVDSIEHGSFLDDEAIKLMVAKGTYLVPTLLAGEHITKENVIKRYPAVIAEKARAARASRSAAVKAAVKAGVKIAFGTDSGVSDHGENAQEFALMVEHGQTPVQALRSATSAAADLLGIGETTGTLAPGFDADIVAVPGDPTKDVRATERVFFVLRAGRVMRL
jgi:imidazolonepropionase-like amidohydrolase